MCVPSDRAGSDLAVELSRHSKQVYLSTRSGSWIMSRISHGLPADLLFNIRGVSWVPLSIKNKIVGDSLAKK